MIEKNTADLSDGIVTLERELDSKSLRIDQLELKDYPKTMRISQYFKVFYRHAFALRVHPLVAFITLDPPSLGVVLVAYLAGLGSVRW